jgi:Sec-independent protein secretion pathway component TatC
MIFIEALIKFPQQTENHPGTSLSTSVLSSAGSGTASTNEADLRSDDHRSPDNLASDSVPLKIMKEIQTNPWNKKLCILWYLLSLVFATNLLIDFPSKGGQKLLNTHLPDGKLDIKFIMIKYTGLLAVAISILWVLTFIVLNPYIQHILETFFWSKLPSHIRERVSIIVQAALFILVVGVYTNFTFWIFYLWG